jgi:hypothetical protein
MPVSKSLQRLLRIRDLQEEQLRLALESAVVELRELEAAQNAAGARERQGRQLIGASVEAGQPVDRQAGLEQAAAARRQARCLALRVVNAEKETMRLRQILLEKRVERRQAETLVSESEAEVGIELNRRSQQALDDWHGSRKHGEKSARDSRF